MPLDGPILDLVMPTRGAIAPGKTITTVAVQNSRDAFLMLMRQSALGAPKAGTLAAASAANTATRSAQPSHPVFVPLNAASNVTGGSAGGSTLSSKGPGKRSDSSKAGSRPGAAQRR